MILAASDVYIAQNIAFGVLALVIVAAAVKVVTTKNVVHAALYLVMVLAGVAAQYILLAAEFIAVVQVLVYIGAIIVLFLFGIMLTQARLGTADDLDNKPMRPWAAGIAVAMVALMGFVLWDQFEDARLPFDGTTTVSLNQTTGQVADTVFGDYLIAFEVISVLLLAALTGAIVLARRD